MALSFIPHPDCFHLFRMVFFISFFSLGGCAVNEDTPESCYSLSFISEGDVNDGSPLKIHLFFLNDRSAFMSADYADLQGNMNKKLANALLGKKHFFLMPEAQLTEHTLTAVSAAKFIGVFAEYKNTAHQHWRLLLPVEDAVRPPIWRRFWPGATDAGKRIIAVTRDGLRQP